MEENPPAQDAATADGSGAPSDAEVDADPGVSPDAVGDEDAIAFAHRLFDLARAGDATLVDYVRAGVPANLTDPDGNTLLMLAAYHGHASLVAALVDQGADPQRANDRGQTPLAGAVFKGEPTVVEVLVAAGADPAAGVPSALDTARMFERDDLLALLQPSGDPG